MKTNFKATVKKVGQFTIIIRDNVMIVGDEVIYDGEHFDCLVLNVDDRDYVFTDSRGDISVTTNFDTIKNMIRVGNKVYKDSKLISIEESLGKPIRLKNVFVTIGNVVRFETEYYGYKFHQAWKLDGVITSDLPMFIKSSTMMRTKDFCWKISSDTAKYIIPKVPEIKI